MLSRAGRAAPRTKLAEFQLISLGSSGPFLFASIFWFFGCKSQLFSSGFYQSSASKLSPLLGKHKAALELPNGWRWPLAPSWAVLVRADTSAQVTFGASLCPVRLFSREFTWLCLVAPQHASRGSARVSAGCWVGRGEDAWHQR